MLQALFVWTTPFCSSQFLIMEAIFLGGAPLLVLEPPENMPTPNLQRVLEFGLLYKGPLTCCRWMLTNLWEADNNSGFLWWPGEKRHCIFHGVSHEFSVVATKILRKQKLKHWSQLVSNTIGIRLVTENSEKIWRINQQGQVF